MGDVLSWNEVHDLWVLLRRTGHIAQKVRDRELSQCGLSAVRSAVLSLVHDLKGKATPAEIARQLLREDHSISYLLSKMAEEGILKKTEDPDRKNMVRIALTKKGRTLRKRSIDNRENLIKMISVLSEEECRQMKMYLQRIQDCAAKILG
ncbi:MarR family winged helix-turn-helix transcriptional regulator [Chloroflexota bacterium]